MTDHLDRMLRGLSLPRRIAHLVAGLGGLGMAVFIGLLWATEPEDLPARTQIAFAMLIGVGLTWAGVAGWMLVRRPMFALDRVIGAWLALAFGLLTGVGTVVLAVARGSVAGAVAGGVLGLLLTGVAAVLLARARAYRTELLGRLPVDRA